MTDQEQLSAGDAGNAPAHTRGAKFFEALLANSGDVLTLLDHKGRYIYHSPAIKEMIGIEPEEALGFFAADLVHSEDRDRVAERIRYCLANRGMRLSENFRLPHADGTWRWIEADVRNLLDDPDIGGVLVVSHDVTSRRPWPCACGNRTAAIVILFLMASLSLMVIMKSEVSSESWMTSLKVELPNSR